MTIMMLCLAALGITLAASRMSFQLTSEAEREQETRDEIELLTDTIRGNPKLRTFGFISDMGRLPSTLSELNTVGAQTAFHNTDGLVKHFMSVGMGWNGIYLPETFKNFYFKDAWGNDYTYTIDTVAVDHDNNAGTATVNWRRAQITSKGADQTISTGDDIKSDLIWESGAVYISPRKPSDFPNIPGWADTPVYSASNGEQTSKLFDSNDKINYTTGGSTFQVYPASTLHHGYHAFELARTGEGAGKKNEQGIFNCQGGVLTLVIVLIPE